MIKSTLEPINAIEHGWVTDLVRSKDVEYQVQPEDGDITKVWAFGLKPGGQLSYYIGLDWLDENKGISLRVAPKFDGADHHSMLKVCLESVAASRFLGGLYDIRADRRFISSESDEFEVLPLLVIHFLVLLEDLLRKPLRKGYVFREENLKAKLKGKVLLSAHLSRNVFNMRPDRIYCRYQEYSIDCVENRLLHSAYKYSISYLASLGASINRFYTASLRFASLNNRFEGIGIITRESELRAIKSNPVYREYGEALRLARLIYIIRGYRDTHREEENHAIPSYIIDMAKLFELYTYALLKKEVGEGISYQVHGKGGGIADFLDLRPHQQMIIDTKYKLLYETRFDMGDMRQVAGYARNTAMLGKLGVEDKDEVVDCLIIYPSKDAEKLTAFHYAVGKEKIPEYHRIYKLGILVPLKVKT